MRRNLSVSSSLYSWVGLIAAALSMLFVGQRTKDGFLLDAGEVLSSDLAMTVMFAVAGLLWQLKNPDNIGKLLEHLKLEDRLTFVWRALLGSRIGATYLGQHVRDNLELLALGVGEFRFR